MLKKYLICFCLLLCLGSAGPAGAESRSTDLPQIRIVTSHFAPFNYLKEGKPTGFCTEIVRVLLKNLNISAPITTLPWARAYQTALKEKNTLIFTIARTPEREPLFHWIGVLVTGQSYLFSLKNRFIVLSSLDQARPYRIGAARDGIRGKYLSDAGIFELDLVADSRMNAVKLLNQRIDLWAEDELAAVHTIRQLGYDPGDILAKSLPLDLKPVPTGYLAFSRDTDKHLLAAFKHALAKFLLTEEYKAVRNRYIHPGPWAGNKR
ncbi:MAG: transporter substrate-binding domain-containing protein [Desulfobacterales bacterium]|nr:transporter substrate-binding domain-containing protein [Desulfobacterales bacterium]